MPRTTKPLTDTEIKKAKPKKAEWNLGDGHGLYLRIKPSGYKVWIFNFYRPFTRKRAVITIGPYPAISLSDARSARHGYHKLLAQNIDPSTYKIEIAQQKRESLENTLVNVAKEWLKVKRKNVSPDYADDILRSLELHVFPYIGSLPINEIRNRTAKEILKPLEAKGSLETVKRVCQRLNEIMSFAVRNDILDSNPLTELTLDFASPVKRHLPTIPPSKLPELMSSITDASIKKTTRFLLEWQLHTMVRPKEAAGTRWDEIDIDNKVWNIPGERMKKKKGHSVPLSDQALALLKKMKPISGHREHVFPSDRSPMNHANSQTTNMALKRMGYGGVLVAHGLRSLASTTLNEEAFKPDVIEMALAHVDNNAVRAAYNRAEYLEQRRVMMQWWSDFIDRAATGHLNT
jgi:integrase